MGQAWGTLIGRSQALLDLNQVEASGRVSGRHYLGLRSVPIREIRGTPGRNQDFDADFNPLQKHTMSRWVGIFKARWLGKPLPAVDLILAGDRYYVRDRHHRISVARALGQEIIDAEVTVWKLD